MRILIISATLYIMIEEQYRTCPNKEWITDIWSVAQPLTHQKPSSRTDRFAYIRMARYSRFYFAHTPQYLISIKYNNPYQVNLVLVYLQFSAALMFFQQNHQIAKNKVDQKLYFKTNPRTQTRATLLTVFFLLYPNILLINLLNRWLNTQSCSEAFRCPFP